MECITLDVEKREELGKNKVNKLRFAGIVPGILYGENGESIAIKCSEKSLFQLLKSGRNHVIEMKIGTGVKENVILHALVRHPITRKFIHADFLRIDLKKEIHSQARLHFTGTPVGVKMGGVLIHRIHDVQIQCLPMSVPDEIVVDIAGLDVGKSLKVKDILTPPGVRILNVEDDVVVQCESVGGSTPGGPN